MKPRGTLRRWPSVNSLTELEPTDGEPYTLYDLALRDPVLRRAHRKVQVLGKALEARIGGPDLVRLTDARTYFEIALFEMAFNVGFENGIIRARAELVLRGHPSDSERQLSDEFRKVVAAADLGADRALVAVLGLAYALADPGVVAPGARGG
jgi:hypothetical protein